MLLSLYTLLFSFFLHLSSVFVVRQQAHLEIHFSNFAGNKPLSPDSIYTNPFGETYTVQRLKYYITNIELLNIKKGKRVAIPDSYFLIDDNEESSKTISLPVAEGDYDGISFLLGVDSLRNVSGAQSGALDPLNGMFWTWNSGYVSVKIEGKSPASNLPQHLIEYHLGGFKGADNVNHRIDLSFPEIEITNKKQAVVFIKTNLDLFFKSIHSLSIKANPACTSPGNLAKQFSENYATMFSIDKVEYKQN